MSVLHKRQILRGLMAAVLLPLVHSQIITFAYADEEVGLQATLDWINGKLEDEKVQFFDGTITTGQLFCSTTRKDYRIGLTQTGALQVTFTNQQIGNVTWAATQRMTDTFNWRSSSSDDIIITRGVNVHGYRGSGWHADIFADSQRNVLALRTDGTAVGHSTPSTVFLIPLPRSQDLQQRILKAFRHLHALATETKEPF